MKKSAAKCVFVSLATLLIAGCTSTVFFNFQPRAVQLSDTVSPDGQALVLGQAYNQGYGDWVSYMVVSVDGTKTYNSLTSARAPVNFLVPAGRRTLVIQASFGNAMSSLGTASTLSGDLSAAQAYQIKGRRNTDSQGKPAVDFWLEHLGTVEEYNAYIARNPKQTPGGPLTRADLMPP